ncbi:hypothetical protein JRO89_XS09G0039700 [Xanthoceras sorbifolium]|uniref:CCHC-type domain-containing protein n=1 Tax=Xanthoceras sorbifolium TaxID=99658 RepID=A0ABQ8HKM0_9ROSI|nr:hypothetical protein JRO89_XS09G0039700 [Xanthoceras sorbifolium]
MTTAVQEANRTQLQVVEQFRKLQPPSFEGTTNPLDFEEWIRELEKVFDFINCTDEQKVSCAAFMLKGDAGHWWEMTKRGHNTSNNPITWTRFKELFNEKYFSEELKIEKESEFIALIQGTMRGLKPNIRKHVHVLGLRTYAEVLQRAQILAREDEIIETSKAKERSLVLAHKKPWKKNFHGKPNNKNRGQKRWKNEDEDKKDLSICETCGKKHGGVCFEKIGACFKCGKPGHYIQNCPELKKGSEVLKKD